MRYQLFALVLAGATLGLPGASEAQSLLAGPDPATGRYAIQPVDGGIARLDTVTGEVSFCRVEAGGMTCRPSEDRAALESDDRAPADEAARLRGGKTESEKSAAAEDAEFERAIGRMRQVFRVFRDIAREFDDEPKGQADEAPDRT